MWNIGVLAFIVLNLAEFSAFGQESCVYHDYCVVGAGPGGLQMGYYLQTSGRDYVVFERSNISGNFYVHYPRHRKLISINKRYTGKTNVEFNLRHDWNSLLSHDPELKFTKYSNEMFPSADVLVQYLKDYQEKLNINVQFNTEIKNVRQVKNETAPDGATNRMEDQNGQCYSCRTLVMANGIAVPKMVNMKGIELAEGYESASIDPKDYEDKAVLLLGRGNSGFEFADGIYGSTRFVHMMGRSRVRLAWATHYVGDLRAVNNGLLDTYQLKSLDALSESDLEDFALIKTGDKIKFVLADEVPPDNEDNFPTRAGYDKVIRSLGFIYDHSVFNATSEEFWSKTRYLASKYPAITHNYESVDNKGMFFAGTASHSLDFRKSAGGFIHGFRYTARALHRLLDWRYEKVPWPHVTIPRTQLIHTIVKRLNEASGIYQMFQYLGDVVIFSKDLRNATYLDEFPVRLLHDLPRHSGFEVNGPVLAIVLEYGKDFSGPGKDVFRGDRAVGNPILADESNFLHPVLYYYKKVPTVRQMDSLGEKDTLPRPDGRHAIVEDFLAEWACPHSHVLPLRRFLENMLKTDLREFTAESCFIENILSTSSPETCTNGYLTGRGLSATEVLNAASGSLLKVDKFVSR